MQVFLVAMILANIAGEMHWSFFPLYLQSLGADVGKIGLFFTLSALVPLALLSVLGLWLANTLPNYSAEPNLVPSRRFQVILGSLTVVSVLYLNASVRFLYFQF